MGKAVWGNDCLFKVNVNGMMIPLVCAEDFRITITTEPINTTTFGNGYWKDYDYQSLTYTISFKGITRMPDEDGLNTAWDILAAQMSAVNYDYEIWFTDPNGIIRVVTGRVIVLSTELSAGINQFSGFTVEMQGCGEFIIRNTACEANISGVSGLRMSYGDTTSTWKITLSGISQEAQIIQYSINDGPRVTLESFTTGTESIDFIVHPSNSGVSTLIVYPQCTTGIDGVPVVSTIDPSRFTF